MRLSFFQSLALTANSNDGYDLLTESFYRVFSKVINLKGPNANKVTLKSKESKFIGYETKLSGSFEIVNDSLKGGSVSSASFGYHHPSSSVAIEPFPIFSIDEADIRVDDLFASGLSLKNAKSAARKALRGDDHIIGSATDDYLRGYKGNDIIYGGEGLDVSIGGRGKDIFVYKSIDDAPNIDNFDGDDSIEKIIDFDSGKDKVDISSIEIPDGWANKEWIVYKTQSDWDFLINKISPVIRTGTSLNLYVTPGGTEPDMSIYFGSYDRAVESDLII